MELEHENFEKILLDCILNIRYKKLHIALAYTKILTTYKYSINVKKINEAIISRWSEGGLEDIKNMTWLLIEGKEIIKREFERNIFLED